MANPNKKDHLKDLKQKPRYRNSISTESPIVMLTPPNPDEVVREERRLSNTSANSIHSTGSSGNDHDTEPSATHSNHDANHLVPPSEPEPEEIVNKLISQRRPSTITTLSQVIKQIFIDKKIKEDGIPSKIIDGLYLGSIGAAKNLEWLKTNNITHILCVAGGIGQCFPKQFKYKLVEINDAPNEDIAAHFKSCFNFIEDAIHRQCGKVLVHCFAGMSRSVTVVSAYLMQKRRMYAVPALKFVKQQRTIANPNAGFIVQLIKFQNVIGLTKQNELDLPSGSDVDESNDDEEEEKADKPKKKTLKNVAFAMKKKQNNNNNEDDDDGHKNLTIHLNSPMVKEWETGRRPSLFTALAKLRGMKNRTRTNSTDSVHSNISAMSTDVVTKNDGGNTNINAKLKANTLLPIVANNNNNINNNNNNDNKTNTDNSNSVSTPISPLDDGVAGGMTPLSQAKLHLLQEVSNETDEDNILAIPKKEIDLKDISQHIALDTHKGVDGDDDPITPLEDYNNNNNIFPDTKTDENGKKPIIISSTQL